MHEDPPPPSSARPDDVFSCGVQRTLDRENCTRCPHPSLPFSLSLSLPFSPLQAMPVPGRLTDFFPRSPSIIHDSVEADRKGREEGMHIIILGII